MRVKAWPHGTTPSDSWQPECLRICVRCLENCTYTHLLHAHFSAHSACTVTCAHLHACAHTRMAQVHEKGVCRMRVFVLHLAFSLLMSHPSVAVSVRLSLSLDFPVHTFLPYSLFLKAQGTRISARGREVWPADQVRPQHKTWDNEEWIETLSRSLTNPDLSIMRIKSERGFTFVQYKDSVMVPKDARPHTWILFGSKSVHEVTASVVLTADLVDFATSGVFDG